MNDKISKWYRILYIYNKLIDGEELDKSSLAIDLGIDERTIQRDFSNINDFFSMYDKYKNAEIIYDRKREKHKLINYTKNNLVKNEILVIIKILLESRAFNDEEIAIVKKLLNNLSTNDKRYVEEIIGNELFNYTPVDHNQCLIDKIWDLSQHIIQGNELEINYIKMNQTKVNRIIKPVSIIFSEYYFYLIAFLKENDFTEPIIYRIDRIESIITTGERFKIPETKRFKDGEFRKRIQFMHAGKLMKIKFEFWGPSIEAVLDRLPTSKIIEKVNEKYIVEAEVYGKGIKMWILSQGDKLKVLEPEELKEEMLKEIEGMRRNYIKNENTYNLNSINSLVKY
ncbi:hypothetical protein Q428_12310 [Fervidicella metallireducens AeB]|uniref:Uncharacterized protein n=1 Tax=Fervidicella metallireducens AeB TaxID=1403537 RepID=A0A017RS94_9CLOT|nr:WYL domain-containing protein [Fervidicella metallireducens]EYE87613.1 hypothetical protein Q428_12310 [Fervidicella metallireducens AeB]